MQALILAGGEGTRLRPLTIYTPKPVVPIVNRPFLFYQLDLLKHAQVHDVTLALSYQPNKIADLLGNGLEQGMTIRYAVETTSLGTAGAYKNSQEHLTQTTVVFNGDIFTDINLADVIAFHREKQAAATIVLTTVVQPEAYGVVESDETGRVLRFREKPSPDEITTNTINAGIYVLEPHLLDRIPAGEKFTFEYHLFPALLAANEPFYAYVWPGYWSEIGTPQRYLQANLDVLNERIQTLKPERKPLNLPTGESESVRIDQRSVVDPSCLIKPGVEIINSVVGPNCVLEERARIEHSVLLASARVGKSAEITGSVIGKSAIIGRNAKVADAILGDKSSLTDYTIT